MYPDPDQPDLFWDEATGNLYSTTEETSLSPSHYPLGRVDALAGWITTPDLLRLGSMRKFLEQAEILLATHKPAMLRALRPCHLLYAILAGGKRSASCGGKNNPELAKMLKGLRHYAPNLMVFL